MRKLTQACKIIAMISASLWLIGAVEARVWRDDFTGEALKDAWTPTSNFFIWEVKDGLLHVKHVKPVQPKGAGPLEALQLTAFPGPYQQLTITATNMKTSGNFGIALGKKFPKVPGDPFFHYVFFTHRIYDRRFSGRDGTSIPFLLWVPRHPGTIWETRELKEMKLIFNVGRFQMFANGKLRADFEDDHFDQIELIRFVMIAQELALVVHFLNSTKVCSSAIHCAFRRR